MKKLTYVVLAALIALSVTVSALAEAPISPSLPGVTALPTLAEPGEGDLTMHEASIVANNAWAKAIEMTDEESNNTNITAIFITYTSDGVLQKGWHFVLRGFGEDGKGAAVVVDSLSGVASPVDIFNPDERQKVWEGVMGPYPFWSLTEKEQFFQLYQTLPEYTHWVAQPTDDMLPQEDAVQNANVAIFKRMLEDNPPLDDYRVGLTFFRLVKDNPGDAYNVPFWSVEYYMQDSSGSAVWTLCYQANVSAVDGKVLFDYNYYVDPPTNG